MSRELRDSRRQHWAWPSGGPSLIIGCLSPQSHLASHVAAVSAGWLMWHISFAHVSQGSEVVTTGSGFMHKELNCIAGKLRVRSGRGSLFLCTGSAMCSLRFCRGPTPVLAAWLQKPRKAIMASLHANHAHLQSAGRSTFHAPSCTSDTGNLGRNSARHCSWPAVSLAVGL